MAQSVDKTITICFHLSLDGSTSAPVDGLTDLDRLAKLEAFIKMAGLGESSPRNKGYSEAMRLLIDLLDIPEAAPSALESARQKVSVRACDPCSGQAGA